MLIVPENVSEKESSLVESLFDSRGKMSKEFGEDSNYLEFQKKKRSLIDENSSKGRSRVTHSS